MADFHFLHGTKIENPKAFGNWIAEKRSHCQLTQHKLSVATRVSTRTISALERGDNQAVRITSLIRLAPGLGVTVEELATQAGPQHVQALQARRELGGSLETCPDDSSFLIKLDMKQVLTKDDLEFLVKMSEQFEPFTVSFAFQLLARRKEVK